MKSQVAFAIGSGRCGTNFMYKLMEKHREVISTHERLPLNDTFMRYVKWYDLNVDLGGCVEVKRKLIQNDLVSFLGTDCHNLYQAGLYEKCMENKYINYLFDSGSLLNSTLL